MSSPPVVPEMHHVNVLVADPSASGEWYCQILGYLKEREFTQDGEVVGVALRRPDGGVRLALRQSPHPVNTDAGVAPIAWSVPTRADLHALALHREHYGVTGGVLQPATSGSLLSYSDPDGYAVNVYSLDAPEAQGSASQ